MYNRTGIYEIVSKPGHAVDARDQRTIARILKVNHAGEHGAMRIYRAQIWIAQRWYPDLMPFLNETLGHEINHRALFRDAMTERRTGPCKVMSLWGNGGLVLGLLTALMSRRGIWTCTAAVESAVHRHLVDQLHFLQERDPELCELLRSIKVEELQHLKHAEEQLVHNTPWSRLLGAFISWTTDVLIWLSTWGASTRMARDLAAAKSAAYRSVSA